MSMQAADSHQQWLHDPEYRSAFGMESAKLSIAVALAEARALAGATQAVLAEGAGVSQAYVAKLEQGTANPTIGNVGRLLAGIWMRLSIQPEPLDPTGSIEDVVIEMAEGIESVNAGAQAEFLQIHSSTAGAAGNVAIAVV